MTAPTHTVPRRNDLLKLADPAWRDVPAIPIATVHAQRPVANPPQVSARVVHSGRTLQVLFEVRNDMAVLSRYTKLQEPVYKDSCVEAFVRPQAQKPGAEGGGYINFEINAGGTMLVTYIADHTRDENNVFRNYVELTEQDVAAVRVETTMPKVVNPERKGPLDWSVLLTLPLSVFEPFCGKLPDLGPGVNWDANFYKCGDETSNPHWISWSSVGEKLSFHQPDKFGHLRFA